MSCSNQYIHTEHVLIKVILTCGKVLFMVQYFLRATFTVFEKQISIAYFSKVPNSVKVAHKKYTTYQEILILF